MIKTRKYIILSAFSFILSTCLVDSLLSLSPQDLTTTNQQKFDTALPSTETTSRKKRMRKRTIKEKKIKRGRTYQDMEYDELIIAKNNQIEKKNIVVAIKYLEQLMKLCTNITQLAEHLLELADLFFIDGQFQKAAHIYSQYCTRYLGSEKQEYALYRSIISSFACILSVDRDQTKTEETAALTELFLQQDLFTHYKDEVTEIQQQCYKQLATKECTICSFYLTRGKLTAAEKRLTKIRSAWLAKVPTLEETIIALETQLAEQKQQALLLNTQHAKLAQNKKTKHMSERF